jgi:hypothetical protein
LLQRISSVLNRNFFELYNQEFTHHE